MQNRSTPVAVSRAAPSCVYHAYHRTRAQSRVGRKIPQDGELFHGSVASAALPDRRGLGLERERPTAVLVSCSQSVPAFGRRRYHTPLTDLDFQCSILRFYSAAAGGRKRVGAREGCAIGVGVVSSRAFRQRRHLLVSQQNPIRCGELYRNRALKIGPAERDILRDLPVLIAVCCCTAVCMISKRVHG